MRWSPLGAAAAPAAADSGPSDREVRCGNSGYYGGLAQIFGVDEFGLVHTTVMYAPPRYLSCAV